MTQILMPNGLGLHQTSFVSSSVNDLVLYAKSLEICCWISLKIEVSFHFQNLSWLQITRRWQQNGTSKCSRLKEKCLLSSARVSAQKPEIIAKARRFLSTVCPSTETHRTSPLEIVTRLWFTRTALQKQTSFIVAPLWMFSRDKKCLVFYWDCARRGRLLLNTCFTPYAHPQMQSFMLSLCCHTRWEIIFRYCSALHWFGVMKTLFFIHPRKPVEWKKCQFQWRSILLAKFLFDKEN